MLLKVFKYSFRKPLKPVLILSACAMGSAVLLGILMRVVFSGVVRPGNSASQAFLSGMLYLLCTLLVMGIIGTGIAGAVVVIVNLSKETGGDQAYLTYTLPVKPKDHLFGRFLVALTYAVIIITSVFLSVYLFGAIIYDGDSSGAGYDFIFAAEQIKILFGGVAVEKGYGFYDVLYYIEGAVILLLTFSSVFFFWFAAFLFLKNARKGWKVLVVIGAIVLWNVIFNVSKIVKAIIITENSLPVTTKSYQFVNIIDIVTYFLITLLCFFISERIIARGINLD